MVFGTLARLTYKTYVRSPDPFWKKRRTLMFSAHFYGRRRNCFKNAIRGVLRAFKHATRGRKDRQRDLNDLKIMRIDAAANEHGINYHMFKESIERCLILLNRRVLQDLAIWEPRTFKALTDVAKCKALEDEDLAYPNMDPKDVSHFIDRGLLEKKAS